MLVGVLTRVEISGGELVTGGGIQLELLSIRRGQVVSLRVEVESPGDGQGSDNLRSSESSMCEGLRIYIGQHTNKH